MVKIEQQPSQGSSLLDQYRRRFAETDGIVIVDMQEVLFPMNKYDGCGSQWVEFYIATEKRCNTQAELLERAKRLFNNLPGKRSWESKYDQPLEEFFIFKIPYITTEEELATFKPELAITTYEDTVLIESLVGEIEDPKPRLRREITCKLFPHQDFAKIMSKYNGNRGYPRLYPHSKDFPVKYFLSE